jgi:hypothetical protein
MGYMVVMLDVEFLTNPREFEGVLVYQYRSGILLPKMRSCLMSLAASQGGMLLPVDVSELAQTWFSAGIFSGIRISIVTTSTAGRTAVLRDVEVCLRTPPALPTVLFISATSEGISIPKSDHIIRIEEPIVTSSNISRLLAFFDHSTDLVPPGSLIRQESFRGYFRQWIKERKTASLSEAKQEFDQSVLLYTDTATQEFLSIAEDSTKAGPSYLTRALHRFLSGGSSPGQATLLRALSLRLQRGYSASELLQDIVEATTRLLQRPGGGNVTEATPLDLTDTYTHTVWAVLLMSWARELNEIRSDLTDTVDAHFLVQFDQFCRDWRRRTAGFSQDPLTGHWSAARETFRSPPELSIDISGLRTVLTETLDQCPRDASEPVWWTSLRRVALDASQSVSGFIDQPRLQDHRQRPLPSIEEMIGRDGAISHIHTRFSRTAHQRSLVIQGSAGAGRRTLARLYAKSLQCSGKPDNTFSICNNCPQCRAFDGGTNPGYILIDLSRPDLLASLRTLIQGLRYSSFFGHRTIVLHKLEQVSDEVDVILKTLENGVQEATFVSVIEDERLVRSALLSRSDILRLKSLNDIEAGELVARWLGGNFGQPLLIALIVAAGLGLPGRMRSLCDLIMEHEVADLDRAKQLFGLGWGREAISYLMAALHDTVAVADILAARPTSRPEDIAGGVRLLLQHVSGRPGTIHPAFFQLERELIMVSQMIDSCAEQLGVTRETFWESLADYWLDVEIFDVQSLIDAGIETRAIVSICAA